MREYWLGCVCLGHLLDVRTMAEVEAVVDQTMAPLEILDCCLHRHDHHILLPLGLSDRLFPLLRRWLTCRRHGCVLLSHYTSCAQTCLLMLKLRTLDKRTGKTAVKKWQPNQRWRAINVETRQQTKERAIYLGLILSPLKTSGNILLTAIGLVY